MLRSPPCTHATTITVKSILNYLPLMSKCLKKERFTVMFPFLSLFSEMPVTGEVKCQMKYYPSLPHFPSIQELLSVIENK